LQRISTSPENAERLVHAWSQVDVTDLLGDVTTPTLVAHARADRAVPVAEGRLLAAGIAGARFLPLESSNHILLADEPAWPTFLSELHAFIA
jgi:pimeloyl-ACP methyl ester carboxylesterase